MKIIFCLVLVHSLVAELSALPLGDSGDNLKLVILHNNDIHGRFDETGVNSDKCQRLDAENNRCFGGLARVAHVVSDHRKRAEAGEIPPVLFLNAGDTYTGTPWFAAYKDKIVSDFLNLLKPDVIVRRKLNWLICQLTDQLTRISVVRKPRVWRRSGKSRQFFERSAFSGADLEHETDRRTWAGSGAFEEISGAWSWWKTDRNYWIFNVDDTTRGCRKRCRVFGWNCFD